MNSAIRLQLLIAFCCANTAAAVDYYLSPQGNDANSGQSLNASWATFAHAVPLLTPGDSLLLADGTYEQATTGLLQADCGAGTQNGTLSQPIVVRALNERQAWLKGSGASSTIKVSNCAYWNLTGLRVSSADTPGATDWPVVGVESSNHIDLRRLLVSHNNRFVNSHLVDVFLSQFVLLEDSEFYWFSRAAVSFASVDHGTIRRVYANSREYPDIDGGYACCDARRGDIGVLSWDTSSNIRIENAVSEGQTRGFQISGGASRINVAGSISLNEREGALVTRFEDGGTEPDDIHFEQFAVVFPRTVGLTFDHVKHSRCLNCSILGADPRLTVGIVTGRLGALPGVGEIEVRDTLVTNIPNGPALAFFDQMNWSATHVNAFNVDAGVYFETPGSADISFDNPNLGACTVYLPTASPMRGRGSDGGDIGANILFEYFDDGGLGAPLWNENSGAFPCGATVSGVNDRADESCFDVHTRLNVGSASCPFPDNSSHPDASLAPQQLHYSIGCGCTSSADSFVCVALLAMLSRCRRRPTTKALNREPRESGKEF